MLLIHLDTPTNHVLPPLGVSNIIPPRSQARLMLNNYLLASMSTRNATISDFKIPVEIILECLLCVPRPRTPDTGKQWG